VIDDIVKEPDKKYPGGVYVDGEFFMTGPGGETVRLRVAPMETKEERAYRLSFRNKLRCLILERLNGWTDSLYVFIDRILR
jgi:hypothetical protein